MVQYKIVSQPNMKRQMYIREVRVGGDYCEPSIYVSRTHKSKQETQERTICLDILYNTKKKSLTQKNIHRIAHSED